MIINEDFLPKDVYSTNEQKTNKIWIDGKPIYRIVIPFTINEYVETYNINLPSGIQTHIKIDIYTTSTASGLGHGLYRVDDTDQLRYFTNGASKIQLKIGTSHPRLPWSGIVIAEYTKTID